MLHDLKYFIEQKFEVIFFFSKWSPVSNHFFVFFFFVSEKHQCQKSLASGANVIKQYRGKLPW
jgi:hypothetical protein